MFSLRFTLVLFSIGCSYLLTRSPAYSVVVYEKNDYIGGHTNTVEVKDPRVTCVSHR